MDIFFTDPSEIPLPPEQVRIREVRVKSGANLDRVHVFVEVDPFQRKPNLEISIFDMQGLEIASTSIIESMVRKIELTMLFRRKIEKGNFRLATTLFYVEIEQPEEGVGIIERQVSDSREVVFRLE